MSHRILTYTALCLLSVLISGPPFFGDIITFKIVESDLPVTTDPANNTITDVDGFFGMPGRALRIEAFALSLDESSLSANTGVLDTGAGTLEFAIDWKVCL